MQTRGVWIEVDDAPEGTWLSGWLTLPDAPSADAVVVLPAVGYDYSSSHRFARMLAERCAADGATVLRLDYLGTGDSTGSAADLTDLTPWRRSVRTAARWLRRRGASRLSVVGVQVGAMLAALELPELAPHEVVTVAGVFSGRRYVRGLSMVGLPAPSDVGGLAVGGTYFSPGLLAELSDTTVAIDDTVAHLAIGATPKVAAFLQQSAEDAVVDPGLVDEIGTWLSARRDVAETDRAAPIRVASAEASSAELEYRGSFVREEFVALGRARMVGVLTTPREPIVDDAVYVLVNSGSDPHIGPGRAWVELARYLAADGIATLRVNFRGWGESPDVAGAVPGRPGRPYDPHGVDDVLDLVDSLQAQGRRVVLGGLCSGAWIALQAAREVDLAGAVVLNPQLYWQQGDPFMALLNDAAAYLQPELDYARAYAPTGRWDREDEQGRRPPAGVWLDDLAARKRPVAMIFAPGDVGIEYLRARVNRRITESIDAGWLTIDEPDVDHSMFRTWLRPMIFEVICARLTEMLRTD